ncbi:MAG: DUF1294 domain-containing protein [Wenzhouxiangella sp.]
MRFQGKISQWDDERGFGFIAPNDGSPRVFLHIKAFSGRGRPAIGALVTYQLGSDERGRPRALKVAPAVIGRKSRPVLLPGPGVWTLLFAFVFVLFVLGNTLAGRLPEWVSLAYVLASLASYLAYWADKSAAQAGAWRVREEHLHLLALVGGWPGALLAQRKFRHKTKKAGFRAVFWSLAALNILVVLGLLSPLGASLMP